MECPSLLPTGLHLGAASGVCLASRVAPNCAPRAPSLTCHLLPTLLLQCPLRRWSCSCAAGRPTEAACASARSSGSSMPCRWRASCTARTTIALVRARPPLLFTRTSSGSRFGRQPGAVAATDASSLPPFQVHGGVRGATMQPKRASPDEGGAFMLMYDLCG